MLRQELDAALLAAESAKHSRNTWVAWIILVGLFIGAWFGGHQGKLGYELGFQAGLLSTREGRDAAYNAAIENQQHYQCDKAGRNCYNK